MGKITLRNVSTSPSARPRSFPMRRSDHREWRVRGLRRPFRLRQVHLAAPDRRAGRHYLGRSSRSTVQGCHRSSPAKRGLAMVFQSYALYPHMTVRNNIAFPLKMAGMDKAADRPRRLQTPPPRVLNLTVLSGPPPAANCPAASASASPSAAPSCASPRPSCFDEPLSNLDAALRVNMRLEITELHQQLKTTMIYVTHDQVEAMTMADKIVVLNAGRIEQVGSPHGACISTARQPLRRRLHRFSPKMNLMSGADYARSGRMRHHRWHKRPEHIDLVPPPQACGRERSCACPNIWARTLSCKYATDAWHGTIECAHRRRHAASKHGDTVYLTPQARSHPSFQQSGTGHMQSDATSGKDRR